MIIQKHINYLCKLIFSYRAKKIITFLLLILTNNILAQSSFFRDTSINVIENNIAFKNAWASGINSAQFNEIDLDLDGNKDIVIFDRTGNKLLPFIKKITNMFLPLIIEVHFPIYMIG